MVEGRHFIIKVKDQMTTVVELHDGRSAVLPYPVYEDLSSSRKESLNVTDNL